MKFRKQIPCPYILVMTIKKGIEEEKDSSNKSTFQFFFLIFFLIQKTPLVILQRKERTIHPFPFPPDAEPHRMGSRRGATAPSPKKLSWQSIWATRANGHTDLQREQKAKRNESTGKKGKIFFTKRYVGSMPKGRRITICKSTSPLLYVVMFS